jgi:hypothetical protein
MSTVYVPIYVSYDVDIEQEIIGVFYNYDSALKALILFVVNTRRIDDAFKKNEDEDEEVYETDSDICDYNYKEDDLVNKLNKYINTFEDLERYCINHGDTYYNEHWLIKMQNHLIQ